MRRKTVVVAGVVATAVLVVALVVAPSLSNSGSQPTAGPSATPSPVAAAATPEPARTPQATPTASALPALDDPDEYAEQIASLVIAQDTTACTPDEVRDRLLAEADPTLSETGRADLERTIAVRIPDEPMWSRMRENQQWSEWTPRAVWEPGAWQQAVTSGYAEPGWAMRNVSGIEVTHYTEDDEPRVSTRERTLSVLMRCPAAGSPVERCHLALLSTTAVS